MLEPQGWLMNCRAEAQFQSQTGAFSTFSASKPLIRRQKKFRFSRQTVGFDAAE